MAVPIATTPEAVDHLESILGYHFTTHRYLLEALKAAGSGYNIHPSSVTIDGNKRLAQVGDAIMRSAVLDDWYTSTDERAVANRLLNSIGSSEILAACGRSIGLEACISTNPSQRLEPPSSAIVARALQALVGAVWLDSQWNFQKVKGVLRVLNLLPTPNV